jgi:hypothetical protein
MSRRAAIAVIIGCAIGLLPFALAQVFPDGSAHAWIVGRLEFLLIPGFLAAFLLRNITSDRLGPAVIAIGSCAFWTGFACLVLVIALRRRGGSRLSPM